MIIKTTKKLFLISLLLFSPILQAQEKFPATFNWRGQDLKLAHQEKKEKVWLVEYILPRQSLQNWSELFGVWFHPGSLKAKDILQQKINFIELRKKSGDLAANYNSFEKVDPQSSQKIYAIDFLLSQPPLYEHSIYLFKDVPGGVLAYQYSRRYDPKLSGPGTFASPEALIQSIPQVRDAIFKELMRSDLPQWSK